MDFQGLLNRCKEIFGHAKEKYWDPEKLKSYFQKERLLNLVARLRGGGMEAKPEEDENNPSSTYFLKEHSKRPKGIIMPKWAKKDWFAKKKLGMMVPPEELKPELQKKRPGDWLRKRVKGTDRAQQFENPSAETQEAPGKVGVSDHEIESFLEGYLSPKKLKKKNPRPFHSKKAPKKDV